MSEHTPTETTNLDRYGSPPLEWSRAQQALATIPGPGLTHFLGTCRPDGTPHAAGVGALYIDGAMYFTSQLAARKARDLAVNPRCTLSIQVPGIDLVLEGTATRLADPGMLERVAATYREGGWPCQVDGDALTAPFSAPSAGPPPWHVFRFTIGTVVAVASAEPHGATRWRFDA